MPSLIENRKELMESVLEYMYNARERENRMFTIPEITAVVRIGLVPEEQQATPEEQEEALLMVGEMIQGGLFAETGIRNYDVNGTLTSIPTYGLSDSGNRYVGQIRNSAAAALAIPGAVNRNDRTSQGSSAGNNGHSSSNQQTQAGPSGRAR